MRCLIIELNGIGYMFCVVKLFPLLLSLLSLCIHLLNRENENL